MYGANAPGGVPGREVVPQIISLAWNVLGRQIQRELRAPFDLGRR